VTLRVTLQEVIQQVRNEARLSTNTSRGIDHLDHIKELIKRHYYTLAEDFEWEHLKIKRDSAVSRRLLQAGDRYYNFPAALNVQTITDVWVKWGSGWLQLDYGITYPDRTAQDPDANQRTDPIRSWAFYGGDQFEVWPIPASNGVANGQNEVAFVGQKTVEQLLSDASRLDLDDRLISLMVATEILAETGQELAAKMKSEVALYRLGRLRANMGTKKRYRMGLGAVSPHNEWPRHPRWVG
jgi:hypothetical protein